MKTKNSSFSHIDSFKTLEAEKMRVYYNVKLSKRKIDLRITELGLLLNPLRILPLIFSELVKPFAGNFRTWIESIFHYKKEKVDKNGDDG